MAKTITPEELLSIIGIYEAEIDNWYDIWENEGIITKKKFIEERNRINALEINTITQAKEDWEMEAYKKGITHGQDEPGN